MSDICAGQKEMKNDFEDKMGNYISVIREEVKSDICDREN
jgi:hypothetical protein